MQLISTISTGGQSGSSCIVICCVLCCCRSVYERLKLVIEPSAAVGVAAVLSAEVKRMPGLDRIGIILCGGNIDLELLAEVLRPSV